MFGSKRKLRLAGAMAVTLALTLAACQGRSDDASSDGVSPGITDTTVKIGQSYVMSGPAATQSGVSLSSEAYFEYVNDKFGGVTMKDGKTRKIEFKRLDDGFEPARMLENTKRLVEQDKVFAMFMPGGTAPSVAIKDYVREAKVPVVFVGSSTSQFGREFASGENPWMIGFQPVDINEAKVHAQYALEQVPSGKAAVLYQNDDFGQGMLESFKKTLEGTDLKLVAEESFELADPTVDSQVATLADSDADVFFIAALPQAAAQAIRRAKEIGWEPLRLLSSTSNSTIGTLKPAGFDNSKGIVSLFYVKDPSDPQWDDDEGMKLYREVLAEHGSKVDPNNQLNLLGMSTAYSLVKALENAEPTRESLMDSVAHLDLEVPFLLPGIRATTDGENDPFPITTLQLAEFDGKRWQLKGDPIDGS